MTCPACGHDVLDIDVKCGSCGAALGASGAHRLLGSVVLGQYELVDVLGQGGMSVVFKGRHKLTNQEVALKILPPELAAHSQVKSRFVEEARALASLDHPNIVHLYNFGEENGFFVLAMQYVQGQTWERMILGAVRLDWVQSCRIAIDVLRALEYAHERGVIHRDMKPSNVLVRARDSVATVMDFGIAKMTTSTRLTATGQTMGTVRYMSPEQVRGQDVDFRTDIYSLGATLYESVVGDTPFDGNTHFEIMTKHLSDAPRSPSERGISLPPTVEDAIMRSLAKRADDRFASAREMRKQLEAALRDGDIAIVETQPLEREVLGALRRGPLEPATATPIAPASRAAMAKTRPARRPMRLIWLAAAFAVIIGSGVATALVVRRSPRFHPSVEIAGVSFTQGAVLGPLTVETDGAVAPEELARLYTSTLGALRLYARTQPGGDKLAIADPVLEVLLGVPAAALCAPAAYLDRSPPADCAKARSAVAIGPRGDHRLMVVSERARLADSVRRGAAQAVCQFAPATDDKTLRQVCDITARFAETQN